MDHVDSASLKGKSKKPKRFLEKTDALRLATAIAGAQEQKVLIRTGRSPHTQSAQLERQDSRNLHLSAAKSRLKETKALLAAQRSRKKNEKAKLLKQRTQDSLPSKVDVERELSPSTTKPRAMKKVSFA